MCLGNSETGLKIRDVRFIKEKRLGENNPA